jgi:hypothetical protein
LTVDDAHERATRLIATGRFAEAEDFLLNARADAAAENCQATMQVVFGLLVELHSVHSPNAAKAEAVCLEREQVVGGAYSRLQTASMRHWFLRDYAGSVAKARQAIVDGELERDEPTIYTALSLLGLGLLELGDDVAAAELVDRIGEMIAARRRVVIGDETHFLEELNTRGLRRPEIKQIASTLAPLCPDPEFAQRLSRLAANSAE